MIGVKWLDRGQLVRSLKEILGEDLIDDGNIENMPMKIVTLSHPEDDFKKKDKQHFTMFYCPDCSHPYAHLYIEKPGLWLPGNNRTVETFEAFCRVFDEEASYKEIDLMSTAEKEELNFSGIICFFAGWGNTSYIRFS
jgi:hypothetical protein